LSQQFAKRRSVEPDDHVGDSRIANNIEKLRSHDAIRDARSGGWSSPKRVDADATIKGDSSIAVAEQPAEDAALARQTAPSSVVAFRNDGLLPR
jgi:hypothetical protein